MRKERGSNLGGFDGDKKNTEVVLGKPGRSGDRLLEKSRATLVQEKGRLGAQRALSTTDSFATLREIHRAQSGLPRVKKQREGCQKRLLLAGRIEVNIQRVYVAGSGRGG